MIKANELRIGNWVNCFDPNSHERPMPHTLKACISWRHLRLLQEENNVHDYSGINLTPEILEKCGFEIVGNYHPEGETCRLRSRVGNIDALPVYHQVRIADVMIPDVRHLHQLQNLYFALTGIELEINL